MFLFILDYVIAWSLLYAQSVVAKQDVKAATALSKAARAGRIVSLLEGQKKTV